MPAPGQYPRGAGPARCGQGGFRGFAARRLPPVFRSPKFFGRFSISGVTRDGTGTALGACTVHLFESATDQEIDQTIADGSGNFAFSLGGNAGFFYLVAHLAGSPDVAGTTVNTLVAV